MLTVPSKSLLTALPFKSLRNVDSEVLAKSVNVNSASRVFSTLKIDDLKKLAALLDVPKPSSDFEELQEQVLFGIHHFRGDY
jgi:hypothetical protein